jgi:hypothetical protein
MSRKTVNRAGMMGFQPLSALGDRPVIGMIDIPAYQAPTGACQPSRLRKFSPEPIRQGSHAARPGPLCGAPFAHGPARLLAPLLSSTTHIRQKYFGVVLFRTPPISRRRNIQLPCDLKHEMMSWRRVYEGCESFFGEQKLRTVSSNDLDCQLFTR